MSSNSVEQFSFTSFRFCGVQSGLSLLLHLFKEKEKRDESIPVFEHAL